MERGKIITHAKSNSSRVVLNNKVYENISTTSVTGSTAENESVSGSTGVRRKQIRLESGQAGLVSRQYRNVNQKEQLLLNTLEKNLSRQKQSAVQSQTHSMQKYKQRLAGYERLRMSGGESINGSCFPETSEQLTCSDRLSRSRAVPRKSTNTSASLSNQGDQSITVLDVNRAREAGPGRVSEPEGQPGVYNVVVTPCDSEIQQQPTQYRTLRSSLKNFQHPTLLVSAKSATRDTSKGKKKLSFEETESKIMLRSPHSLSCSPPDLNLLSVNEDEIRPRAYTDPTSDGKSKLGIKLPEITIEDFSDPEDKANSDDGMFSVFSSPPRRRANTCPEEFFSRRRKGRPPTPPPTSRNGSPTNKFHFGIPNKSPVSFVHHKLSKVSEDGGDNQNSGRRSSGHVSRRAAAAHRRSSLNCVSALSSNLDSSLTLKEEEPSTCADTSSSNSGRVAISEAGEISENNKISGFSNQGQDVSDVYSSKDCRFSQKISPTLDSKTLEAC